MSQTMQARLPKGMRDILPQQMIKRRYVIDVISRVFEESGFEPLQTPAIERAETLMGKYGPDAEKLIYRADHVAGKEKLALRYDLSVPLCRLVGMNPQMPLPFKRYQIAPVWRAERPQKGRYREFYQCDCDTIGSSSMLADAEVMCVIYRILDELGFRDFDINLNNRKILNGIGDYSGVPEHLLGGLYRSIDKLDKIGLEGVKEELIRNEISDAAVSRMMDLLRIEGSPGAVLSNLKKELAGHADALAGIAELEEIIEALGLLGVPDRCWSLKFAMVRGLDYYTGPIYETTIEEPKMPSITGGGRYDRLIGMFLKESLPATGTTIGIERIIDALEEMDAFPPALGTTVVEVLVTLFNAELAPPALRVAGRLREAGLRTELYFEPASLKSQFKYANRKGIPFVAVLGPDENERGEIALRDFSSGSQTSIPQDAVADMVAFVRSRRTQ